MIEIEKPQIECIETPGDASYGKYVIEPLERGYGTTLGNALRRIMLSSLPGTAATSIKIAGVQHEFSTIPGVKEDVTEIVLNVKSLLTKLHCEGTKTVYIEATGPCEVTAGDIKSDGEVEVLNPRAAPGYPGCGCHPEHGNHPEPRPRLCVRRSEQGPAPRRHWRDPHRLHLYPRV